MKIKLKSEQGIAKIIVPVIFILVIFFIGISTLGVDTSNTINNTIMNQNSTKNLEGKKLEVSSLNFNETTIEMDITESKSIVLEIEPVGVSIEEIKLCSLNEKIAVLEEYGSLDENGKVNLKVKALSEGETELYVKSTTNGIESNKVKIKIIDNARIEKERLEAEEKAAKSSSVEPVVVTQTSKSTVSTTEYSSQNVYVTPTGKRYHYSKSCAGKNGTVATIDKAISMGLTPCKKCVE